MDYPDKVALFACLILVGRIMRGVTPKDTREIREAVDIALQLLGEVSDRTAPEP